MNVKLKPEFEERISEDVAAGRCSDAGEFLNKAVSHYLAALDLIDGYTAEEMDRLVAEGMADVESGNTYDGDEAFRMIQARSEERRAARP